MIHLDADAVKSRMLQYCPAVVIVLHADVFLSLTWRPAYQHRHPRVDQPLLRLLECNEVPSQCV
jgi:hypothetical protein